VPYVAADIVIMNGKLSLTVLFILVDHRKTCGLLSCVTVTYYCDTVVPT